ncbi:MAG: tryptophan-rich sensory protein [Candidatus Krumholzibacteria bacterium]|nr:tryptophan-rich sensory protein [Candidatus Krumholzibacteria bacterium]
MSKLLPPQTIKLAAGVALCLLAGFIGSIATTPKVGSPWYAGLARPSFSPPGWLFAPVWTILYLMMGVALYLVWRKGLAVEGVKVALAVFLAQLVLNALWSFAFFGAESPLYGLVVIVALWVTIVATIVVFAPISRTAAVLLVPYILWVSFATILNASIYLLNR